MKRVSSVLFVGIALLAGCRDFDGAYEDCVAEGACLPAGGSTDAGPGGADAGDAGSDAGVDAGPQDSGFGDFDAGNDAGPGDAGPGDAGPGDAGPGDAGPGDAGPGDAGPGDAGPGDAGPPDAGPPDAGPPDAGPPDAGPPDAGPPDAGPPDAGPPDAGPPDAGPPDAGPPDAGPVDAGFDAGPACPAVPAAPPSGTYCVNECFCWDHPKPFGYDLHTVVLRDGGAITAGSDRGLLLTFVSGQGWSFERIPTLNSAATVRSLWTAGDTMFALTDEPNGVYRRIGNGPWEQLFFSGSVNGATFATMHASDPDNVWIGAGGGLVARLFAGSFVETSIPSSGFGRSWGVRDLYVESAEQVFAVGEDGLRAFYGGGLRGWTVFDRTSDGGGLNNQSLHTVIVDRQGAAWTAGGAYGATAIGWLPADGGEWISPKGSSPYGVYHWAGAAAQADGVTLVASGGTSALCHDDGGCSFFPLGGDAPYALNDIVRDVVATSATNAVAVGRDGFFATYSSGAGIRSGSGTFTDVADFTQTSAGLVARAFTSDGLRLIRYNPASGWLLAGNFSPNPVQGGNPQLSGTGAHLRLAVNETHGPVFHNLTPSQVVGGSPITSTTRTADAGDGRSQGYVQDIWTATSGDSFAVGGDFHFSPPVGAIWSIPGTTGTATFSNPTLSDGGLAGELSAVWGSAATDVYAVGHNALLHFTGAAWVDETPPPLGGELGFAAVHGTSGSNVWAATRQGHVFRRDATGIWQSQPAPPFSGMIDQVRLAVESPDEVWILVLLGPGNAERSQLFRWTSASGQFEQVPQEITSELDALHLTSSGDLLLGGKRGTILRSRR